MSQEEFLIVFNDLEQTLQNKYDTTETIYDLLEREKNALENNPVKANWEVLDIARRLRNILAHETTTNLPVVATPSQQIIDVVKKVAHAYRHPKTVKVFLEDGKREKILSFQVSDDLKVVLKLIHQKQFSQFPVFDESGYVGLISNNGIANWLAAMSEQGSFSAATLEDTKVAEVLDFEENGDSVIRLYEEEDLFQILNRFTASRVRVALICKKEDRVIQTPSDIIGIVTKSDLGQIVKEVTK